MTVRSRTDDDLDDDDDVADRGRSASGVFVSTEQLMEQWRRDDLLSQFLSSDEVEEGSSEDSSFDSDRIVCQLLESDGHLEIKSIDRLTDALRQIDRHINHQVVSHHDDLLRQSNQIDIVERDTKILCTQSASLLARSNQVQSLIVEPFLKIKSTVGQLQSTSENTELFRQVQRFLQLYNRMKSFHKEGGAHQADLISENTQLGLTLSEIMRLRSAINPIVRLRSHLLEAEQQIAQLKQITVAALRIALENHNQADIGSHLQIAYNLQALGPILQEMVDAVINQFKLDMITHIDVGDILKSPKNKTIDSNAKDFSSGSALRNAIFVRLEQVVSTWTESISRISTLELVVGKKCHQWNNDLSSSGQGLLIGYFLQSSAIIEQSLSELAASSSLVRGAFDAEFPRLFALFNGEWRRTLHVILPVELQTKFLSVLKSFHDDFISRSSNEMQSPLSLMFGVGADRGGANFTNVVLPTRADVSVFTNKILSIFHAVGGDVVLERPILQAAAASIGMFSDYCKDLVHMELTQSPVQWTSRALDKLSAVFCLIGQVDHTFAAVTVGRLRCQSIDKVQAVAILGPSRRVLRQVGRAIIEPLVQMAALSIENRIAEDYDVIHLIEREMANLEEKLLRISVEKKYLRGHMAAFIRQVEKIICCRLSVLPSMNSDMTVSPDIALSNLSAIRQCMSKACSKLLCADQVHFYLFDQIKAVISQDWALLDSLWQGLPNNARNIPHHILICSLFTFTNGAPDVCNLLNMPPFNLLQFFAAHSEDDCLQLLRFSAISTWTSTSPPTDAVYSWVHRLI